MITLFCDNCGNDKFIVEGGVVHCLNCESTYPTGRVVQRINESILEETRRLIENTGSSHEDDYVRILGSIKVALSTANLAELNQYCDQLIEKEPNSSIAWLLKSEAVGWSTTLRNLQSFDSAVSCMLKAISLARIDEMADISNLSQFVEFLGFTLSLQILEQLTNKPSGQNLIEYYAKRTNILGKGAAIAVAVRSKTVGEASSDSGNTDGDSETESIIDNILIDVSIQTALAIWNAAFEEYDDGNGGCDLTRFWNKAFLEYDKNEVASEDNTYFAHWLDVCFTACNLLDSSTNVDDLESASFNELVLAANACVAESDCYSTMNKIIASGPWDKPELCFDEKISELQGKVEDIKAELDWRSDQRMSELASED